MSEHDSPSSGAPIGAEERRVLAALADILIPAGDGFPAASEAGVATTGIDRVLAARRDLAEPLVAVLQAARDRDPAAVVEELRAGGAVAGFAVLGEVVAAAYFLDPGVRRAFRYDGQSARPIDPRADDLDAEFLQSVIDRGPIYRPTPERDG